ncbi:hypothetical protein SUNI508_01945 [Seiridium unicorne]|uniref:Uncharacterized protein n=1 Tax=Seiridium unicorne TaxID=138068 RepID=A0ABR2UKE8_9PEZI
MASYGVLTTDSRQSSIDESRPLDPNGDGDVRQLLSPKMIQPPYPPPSGGRLENGGYREVGITLVSVLRILVIAITFSNIIVEIKASPRRSLEVFLAVYDWCIMLWSVVALRFEPNRNGESILPPITMVIGERTFHVAGVRPHDELSGISENPSTCRSTRLTSILRGVVDVVFVLVLFSTTIASDVYYRHRYRFRRSGTIIDVLHYVALGLMFTILALRFSQARSGFSITFKIALGRDGDQRKYRLQPPRDEISQQTMHPTPASV